MSKIFIGSDHAGYELKEALKSFLIDLGHEIEDKGAYEYDKTDDYPDYIVPVAQAVITHEGSKGIVLGGSGQGEAMVANKFPGVRAIVFNGNAKPELDEISLSREHNDSNVLAIGARFLNEEEAKEAVKRWIETPFTKEERHVRRIDKIKDVEKMLYGE